MVKGIINAFAHMEFCLVLNLTMGGKLAVTWPPKIAAGMLVCYYHLYHVASTCYPQKNLISNNGMQFIHCQMLTFGEFLEQLIC